MIKRIAALLLAFCLVQSGMGAYIYASEIDIKNVQETTESALVSGNEPAEVVTSPVGEVPAAGTEPVVTTEPVVGTTPSTETEPADKTLPSEGAGTGTETERGDEPHQKGPLVISLSQIVLIKGETVKLEVTRDGVKEKVIWTTSVRSIAGVGSAGKVTAKKFGEAVITATTEDGRESVSCKVTVVNPTLNSTQTSLFVGDTYQLKVKQYTGELMWSTADPKIVSVDRNGVIKGCAKGSTTISVVVNGIILNCKVDVYAGALNAKEVYLPGDSTFQLRVSGEGLSGKGSFKSSNDKILKVSSSGLCTPVGSGEAQVTYTIGGSKLYCYFLVGKKGASQTFPQRVQLGEKLTPNIKEAAFGENGVYRILQGCCTDGTYGYYLLKRNNTTSDCAIVKIRLSDGKFIKARTNLRLDHGNDMAYDSDRKLLVVVHGEGNATMVSFIKPKSLKLKNSLKISKAITAISYNALRKSFVTEIIGQDYLEVFDRNFKDLGSISRATKGSYTRQGIDCDDRYIYVLDSNVSGSKNRILVYDWDCHFITQILINGRLEGESLFHVGNTFYLGCNSLSYNGGTSYITAMKKYYTVRYDAGGGQGTMASAAVDLGKGYKAKACGFTNPGYRFAGYKIKRGTDGRVFCVNTATKTKGWYAEDKIPAGYKVKLYKKGKKTPSLAQMAGESFIFEATWKW